MKTVRIHKDTLKHIVDALAAARACGLRSDLEQVVFDLSVERAGGIIPLAKLAGMIKESDYRPKRDTDETEEECEPSSSY